MKEKTQWDSYQLWHHLLDSVCVEEGFHDNMALANELSAASGNRSGEAFDAALKNLRNWRNGTHLPQRRNFILLTKALHVDSHEGLREHWTALYAKARKGVNRETGTAPNDAVSKRSYMVVPLAATIAVLVVLAGGAIYFFQSGFEVSAEGEQVVDVEYRKSVSLSVGQSIVVHGSRAACGEQPPSWEKVAARLPELEIGHWSDGDIGTRYSRKCGGPTPARGIVFNATKSGFEEIKLYGDPVKIEVK